MSDLFGVRIQQSRWLPKGTAVALGGHFDLPPEWADLKPEERFRYALAHGAVLITGVEAEGAE